MARSLCALFLCAVLTLVGCSAPALAPVFADRTADVTAEPPPLPSPSPASSPSPIGVLTPSPSPAPEPPRETTLGFVGDILMMESQIKTARTKAGYDFTRSFKPMRSLFESVDLMCGNFEGALAGEDAGYSEPRATQEPLSELNPSPTVPPFQSFNAPDELAYDLKALGFDALTTANNHCLDRGYEGLCRTAETIRSAGLLQTGTFSSEQERQTPLVVNVNGFKIGIVAATESVNSNDGLLKGDARSFAVARLFDKEERVKSDIAACHMEGAEFIIVCAHWGDEFQNAPNERQKRAAKKLIEWGADAILGSHPHVVQPIEYVEAKRGDGNAKALVVWSLGNFISNMSPSPKDYGLFVRLTLARDEGGAAFLKEAGYLTVYCAKQTLTTGERLHQTLPCYEDVSLITACEPPDRALLEDILKARKYVIKICGTDAASLLG
ncbi:MAG TPA: CapA family protein [Clostridia bacterium]|nr:CapA family protein [Clostridia bacterium]